MTFDEAVAVYRDRVGMSPEAARGGPIAAVRDGDAIVIDPGARTVNLEVAPEEIACRMADWRAPARPRAAARSAA